MKILLHNPIVFLDIAVANEKIGRVIIELLKNKVPKTAENFKALCTGERGIGINGKPLCYKGSYFHKVVRQLMVQGGDIVNFDGSSGESIYGLYFEDEDLNIPHDSEGLLSTVNEGKPNSNSSQFVITMASCPQLNKTNVVFGKVIKGLGIIKELSEIPAIKDEPVYKISIIDCGELKEFANFGLEDNDGEDIYAPYPEDSNYSLDQYKFNNANAQNIVKNIKNVGNAYFLKKKYYIAERKYKKALRYYDWIKMKGVLDNYKYIVDLKTALLLNLAAVKLCQFKYRQALNFCEQVLEIDNNNSKALFRRSQAYMGLNEYELSLADLKTAKIRNPTNKTILIEIRKIKTLMQSYLELEKVTCKRMLKLFKNSKCNY